MTTLPKRFKDKINFTDSCWLWKSTMNADGYGVYSIDDKIVRAHRFSWEHFIGAIPEGLNVLHKCDVRNCINPDHLFLGTIDENNKDKALKGRSPHGEDHPHAKLTYEDVLEIRIAKTKESITNRELAKRYMVSHSTLWQALNGETWKHVAMPV